MHAVLQNLQYFKIGRHSISNQPFQLAETRYCSTVSNYPTPGLPLELLYKAQYCNANVAFLMHLLHVPSKQCLTVLALVIGSTLN